MTNHIHAKAEWIEGAWRALVRYSHKADYQIVMNGSRPAGFPTRDAAEIAALRAQERHINGTITGFGEPVNLARAAAEKHFRKSETIRKPGKRAVLVIQGSAG